MRRGAVLHGDVELVRRGARPQPARDRPDHRREQRTTSATSRWATRAAASPASASAATTRRAAAPAWPPRSATTSPSTTWRTRWATSSPATTPSTARWATAAATAAARPRSSRAPARRSWPTPASAASDNLQPHSDPYWVPQSYDEILSLVTVRPRADQRGPERLAARLRRHRLGHAELQRHADRPVRARHELHRGRHPGRAVRASEVQRVAPHRLRRQRRLVPAELPRRRRRTRSCAARTTPPPASPNAIQGGNEQQQVTLTNFNATTQSFTISIGGNTSTAIGLGGAALSNANIQAAINAIAGFAGGATVAGAGNGGFTVTFARRVGRHRRLGALDRQLHRHGHRGRARERQGRREARDLAGRRGTDASARSPTAATTCCCGGAPFTAVDADPFSVAERDRRDRDGQRDHQGRGLGISAPARPPTSPASSAARSTTPASRSASAARSPALDQPLLGLTVDRRRPGFVGETAQRRPGRQQGLHGHADRQPRAGRHRAGAASRSRRARRSR